jgi:hypothetical protein
LRPNEVADFVSSDDSGGAARAIVAQLHHSVDNANA